MTQLLSELRQCLSGSRLLLDEATLLRSRLHLLPQQDIPYSEQPFQPSGGVGTDAPGQRLADCTMPLMEDAF